jgi:hypothetical protein
MLKRVENKKQSILFLKAAIIHYLFFVAFLFVCENHVSFTITHQSESVIHQDYSSHFSEKIFSNPDSPFHRKWALVKDAVSEVPDESESDEKFDEEKTASLWNNSASGSYGISEVLKSRFFQAIESLRNRKTVSLFILYHSWKSFLS